MSTRIFHYVIISCFTILSVRLIKHIQIKSTYTLPWPSFIYGIKCLTWALTKGKNRLFSTGSYCVTDLQLDCTTNGINVSWGKPGLTTFIQMYNVSLLDISSGITLQSEERKPSATSHVFNGVKHGHMYRVAVVVHHRGQAGFNDEIAMYQGSYCMEYLKNAFVCETLSPPRPLSRNKLY